MLANRSTTYVRSCRSSAVRTGRGALYDGHPHRWQLHAVADAVFRQKVKAIGGDLHFTFFGRVVDEELVAVAGGHPHHPLDSGTGTHEDLLRAKGRLLAVDPV
jgi:hypothetical protein